jgi:tetratricopeptide (TPR) repeat protein
MLAQDAKDGDAHYGLGLVLMDQKSYQAAVEEFKAAVGADSQMSGIYYEMGNAYANLKMYDDAIAAFLKEKDRDGDNPDVESALADTYQAKGMARQAEAAKKRAEFLKSENGQP